MIPGRNVVYDPSRPKRVNTWALYTVVANADFEQCKAFQKLK